MLEGPVHTSPDIFESAPFSNWIRLPCTRIGESGIRINPQIFESALQSGKGESGFLIRKEKVADSKISGYVWTRPKMGEISSVQCSKLHLFKFNYPIHLKAREGINSVLG